jgi:acid phosphatase family membrane protein YuiD
MNLKIMIFLSLMMILPGCTELAMLMSTGGLAVSHNAYVKAYNGVEVLTIINTEKDIKTHLYETIRHAD